MSALEILPLVVLGALCGLDVVSFPQGMLSRPIVASTAAGALAGSAGDGLIVGAVLELIALDTLPFGASRYPEWGTASVVGGALYAQQSSEPGALPLAVFAALGAAMLSGWTMVAARKWNGRLAGRLRPEIERGSRDAVMRLQLGGMTADLARAATLTAGLYLVLAPVIAAAAHVWGVVQIPVTAIVVGIAAAVAGGIVWKGVPAGGGRIRILLIAAGVIAAIAVAG